MAESTPRCDARRRRAVARPPRLATAARGALNTAADAIQLTAAQLERLNDLKPAAGARHDDVNMATIDR